MKSLNITQLSPAVEDLSPAVCYAHLSGTVTRAAAGPSCWGSRCCSSARTRTAPPTRSGCRTAGGRPAAPRACSPPTTSSAPWRSLRGSGRRRSAEHHQCRRCFFFVRSINVRSMWNKDNINFKLRPSRPARAGRWQ